MQENMPGQLLATKAYLQIEEMIVMRRLPPGSMVSENLLGAELGCGRTPVREALMRLKFEGFIEIYPRRGALVLPVDISKQLELLEVRRPLETLAAELGCRRATADQRREMRELGTRLVEVADLGMDVRYFHMNRAIHELRLQSTHNAVLIQSLGVIFALSRWFWYAHLSEPRTLLEAANRHRILLNAMADGDREASVAASNQLIELVAQLTENEINRRS